MIPENISKRSIVKAMEEIDKKGIPKNRQSKKYNIRYKGRLYPPKYTISLANKYENGKELKPNEFGGGLETNNFLERVGFKIIGPQQENFILKDQKEKDIKEIGPDNNKNTELGKGEYSYPPEEETPIKVGTVLIESNAGVSANLFEDLIVKMNHKVDILLFPAGFFIFTSNKDYSYADLSEWISGLIDELNSDMVVCLGIDTPNGIHQLGFAIDRKGILAIGRKFHPTDGERNIIRITDNHLSKEDGYSRIFKVKGKSFYIAVCYDTFGIRKSESVNPGVDAILNLVHGFYPAGWGNSGDVYFARHGFAGASGQWECPVFASAIFYNRKIPTAWPSGVLRTQNKKSTASWKYADNEIKAEEVISEVYQEEKIEVRTFTL